jgi:2-keto-4-pentenoate hydratase/2-oxohepta-3-ene-1,7-dioic acid hydratase in catechol pathway
MRVVTFKKDKSVSRIGLVHGDKIADLRAAFERSFVEGKGIPAERAKDEASQQIPDSMLDLISRGEDGITCIKQAYEFLDRSDEKRLSQASSPGEDRILYEKGEVQILKPLEVFRALNVGANYNAYLSMMKIVEPYEGTVETFWVLPQTVIGPDEEIIWPVSSGQVSCEMELGVIIGKKTKRVSRDRALDCVFGYTVVNDVTAIDLIKRGLGGGREGLPGFFYLCLAKSFDTFEPIGPCITLKDEIPDPQALKAEYRVNGEMKVKGDTSDMRLKVAEIIEFLSQDITLYPGDLIATGAMATEEYAPQVNVKVGDKIEMEIEKIGVLKNRVAK